MDFSVSVLPQVSICLQFILFSLSFFFRIPGTEFGIVTGEGFVFSFTEETKLHFLPSF